jgi:hypothetical protein
MLSSEPWFAGATRLGRVFLLLALLPSGCATFSAQPATPARYLDLRGLEQAPPCERYYLLVFSSENELRQPRYTHTWATAVRVVQRGAGQEPWVEHHSISWMPATLEIHPLRFRVEPGVNLNLHDSITKVALANREDIKLWGPYECKPRLYTRFLVQKQFMESSKMGYQCIDTVGEAGAKGNGSNCIHAISDMDPEHGRQQYPLTRYGFAAGREITRRIRELGGLVQPERTHDYLIPALGLNAYPIERAGSDEIFGSSRVGQAN